MKRLTVNDVMTKQVVTVEPDAPYKEIVTLMVAAGVSALPVATADRRVVGIVSEADLLHKLEFSGLVPHEHLLERRRRRVGRAKAAADRAGDLMTAPAVTTSPGESLPAVARLMDSERVKRLPVVDAEGQLVGVVSRQDLVRLYLRDDDEIRDEVINEILIRTLWQDPSTVDVSVDRGVVTLAGTVEERSTIPILVRLVETVTAVVEVVDHLTYRRDDTAEIYDSGVVGLL